MKLEEKLKREDEIRRKRIKLLMRKLIKPGVRAKHRIVMEIIFLALISLGLFRK